MARHRKIDLRMHGDEKYRQLTPCPPCGQALWWQLLAGKQTGIIPGLCSIGEASFAEQLRWPLKGFREAFAEVSGLGMAKADWRAPLIWIPRAVFYNQPESANVVKSWRHAWDELPECELKIEAHALLKAFVEGHGKGFAEAFRQACPEPSLKSSPMTWANQEQEQEQDTPQPPKGGMEGFEDFWKAYPRKVAKPAAAKAWRRLKAGPDLLARIVADLAGRSQSPAWAKDDGQFIPHPATYLNARRWEDEGVTLPRNGMDPEIAARYAASRAEDD